MKLLKRFVAIALSSLMAFSLVACGGGSDNKGENASGPEDKMFNVVMLNAFSGLDPLRTNDSASTNVTAQIYETLYKVADDGSFVPVLAESLPEYSEDGMSATVKLREGVKFHDGTPFNAEAVKYTFDLIKDPEFGSARASIAGSIESMDILDEYTIKFNLKYEDGVLTAKLAHTNSSIVSPTAQKNQDLMVDPVGTGPYKFVSSISGSNVVLTRNDEYWGEKPQIKDVTFTIISEESTALARMETGEADFLIGNSVESLPRIESMSNVISSEKDSAQICYVALRPTSSHNPIMENPEFRKAIVMALDRESYVNNTMNGHAKYAKSVIGPKVIGYDATLESHNIGYDPEGARAIIEKNGWADEEILLLCPSTPTYAPMGEFFYANLKAAGFNNVKLEMMEWSAWLTEAKADNRFDLTVAAWTNVTRDGSELFEPNWHSEIGKRNRAGSKELDGYIEESKTTSDIAVRKEAFAKCNNYLMDNAIVAPIFNGEQRFVYNNAYECSCDTSGTFHIAEFKIK